MTSQLSKSDFKNYQTAGYHHVLDNDFCGLILDMGLGKTIITLTAINTLLYEELEIRNALVVSTKRVVESVWDKEAIKWSHTKHLKFSKIIGTKQQRLAALNAKADIYTVSVDNFAWLCSMYGGMRLPFDMVIFDESSKFKSYKSIRFKAAKKVRPSFERVVILTGTFAPNGLIDLWSQMFLVDRGLRLEKTITRYREKYFTPGLKQGQVVFKYNLLPGADELIYNKIDDVCISMKTEDYVSLPERIDNYIWLDMPEALKKQYDDFEKSKILELFLKDDSKEISVVNAAALTNKLLQFSNGAVYDEDREVHEVHKLKIEALLDIIDESNGENIIVVWAYRHDLERLKIALKKYNPRELKTNQDIDDWNNGKIRILLTHPASGGHGLNLQFGGHTMVWFGLNWSLELYQQMVKRLHRLGQNFAVVMHHILLRGSHDENVLKALEAKDKGQESLMSAIKAKILKYTQR